jgi:branched-chain amino acid transport system permease protein
MSGSVRAKRQVGLWYDDRFRRLISCLAAGVGLALVTGATGTQRDYGFGLKHSLLHEGRGFVPSGRLVICLGVGVLVWALVTYGPQLSGRIRGPERRERMAQGLGLDKPGVRRSAQAGVGLVIAAALIVVPILIAPYWREVLVTNVSIVVLLALGLNVVVGWAGLLDLGYVAFYAIGSYMAAYWTGHLPVKPPFTVNPFLTIPFAVLACLVAGVLLGAPTLRLRGDYLAIVTLGFGEIVRITANNSEGITNGPRGASNLPHFSVHLGPIDYEWGGGQLPYWYTVLALLVIVVLLFRKLEHSRIGRAWTAIREDEVAAQASGVRTVQLKLLAFAIGASTAGLSGVVNVSKNSAFAPNNFTLIVSILIVAYVVFGGMGSMTGVIVGTAVLTFLPEVLKNYLPTADQPIYFGAILVIMMIFRPAGLIPAKRRRMELARHDEPTAETVAVAPAGSVGGGVEA